MGEEKKQGAAAQAGGDLLQIRRDKLTALQEAGQDPFQQTRFDFNCTTGKVRAEFDALENTTVRLAGRMMSKRVMGKVSFCDLQDRDGRLQLYVRRDELGDEAYAVFKKFDIGDIIGVEGTVFRTQRGEMSVRCASVTLLSKSLQPLPEKFHGLQDKELRYRQRYVDLIMNPEVKRNFMIRSQFIRFMRSYLDGMGFIEVETPVLNTIAGGAAARPFVTHHNTLDIDING